MSKRIRLILPLLCIMLLALSALVFTACEKQFTTEQDVIDQGYTIAVKFDFQGGRADESGEKLLRVKENSWVPKPGTGALSAPSRTGYTLKEYGVAETDEEGKIVYENDLPKIKKVWDFNKDRATESMTLCAIWWKNFTLKLHYTDENKDGADKNSIKEVDVPRNAEGLSTLVSASSARISGMTVLGYYLDENKVDGKISFPYTFNNFSDDNMVIDVWCDNLTGIFQIIRKAKDLTQFAFLQTTNVYLMTDIDMNDVYKINSKFNFPSTYGGKFIADEGVRTISNFKIEKSQSGPRDGDFGIFNVLDSGAEISGISFVNVDYTAKLTNVATPEFNVGMLAGRIREKVTLNNVTVSGTLKYSVASGVDENKIHMLPNNHYFAGTTSGDITLNGCDFTGITLVKAEA